MSISKPLYITNPSLWRYNVVFMDNFFCYYDKVIYCIDFLPEDNVMKLGHYCAVVDNEPNFKVDGYILCSVFGCPFRGSFENKLLDLRGFLELEDLLNREVLLKKVGRRIIPENIYYIYWDSNYFACGDYYLRRFSYVVSDYKVSINYCDFVSNKLDNILRVLNG